MKNRMIVFFLLSFIFLPFFWHSAIFADTAEIASVSAHYAHPITGAVEDPGNNGAIGQGMTESVLDPQALIETDRDGKINATIRLHLADQLGNYQIGVQSPGASGFSSVQTQEMRRQGEQLDLRFPLPSKEAIIRLSLDVKPMGRAVIFYGQLGSRVPGNTDFILSVQPNGQDLSRESDVNVASTAKNGPISPVKNSSKKSSGKLENTPFFGDEVGLLMKGDSALEKGLKGDEKNTEKGPYGFYTKLFLASFGICIAVLCFLIFIGGLFLFFGYKRLQKLNDYKEAKAYENENKA